MREGEALFKSYFSFIFYNVIVVGGQVKNVTVDRSGCGRERRRRTGGPIGRGCRNNGEKIWQRGRSSRGEAQEARSDDV